MGVPSVDYSYYAEEHVGAMSEEDFDAALPEASARLVALTGSDVPARCADAWRHALCAMCDRVGGYALSGAVSHESVGSTSLTYSDAFIASEGSSDFDAVAPWLADTGLLCSILRRNDA